MKNSLYFLFLAFALSCGSSTSEEVNQEEINSIKLTTELSPMVMPHIYENGSEMIPLPDKCFVEMDKLIELVVGLKSAPVSEQDLNRINLQIDELMQKSSIVKSDFEPLYIDYLMPLEELKNRFIGVKEQQQFIDVKDKMKNYLGSFYLLFSIQDQD